MSIQTDSKRAMHDLIHDPLRSLFSALFTLVTAVSIAAEGPLVYPGHRRDRNRQA
jgi:hypothetical protein